MKSDPLMEQVTGILVRAQVPFEFHEDGEEIGVGTDHAVVFMRPRNRGEEKLLHLEADLAVGIEMSQEVASGIYVWLNHRNADEPMARFVLHEAPREDGQAQTAWVSAEWELQGDGLQALQLLSSLEVLADRAGGLADRLVQLFGGQTPADLREECRELNSGWEGGLTDEEGPHDEHPGG